MLKKHLLLSGVILSFALAGIASILVLTQSSFIYNSRLKYFDKKSKAYEKNILDKAHFFIKGMQEIAQSHKIGEILSKKTISTMDFSYLKQTGLSSLHLVNHYGNILFSSELFLNGKSVYSNIIGWSKGDDPLFFFIDKDTLVGIVRYQDPTSIEQTNSGYVIAEFPSDTLINDLSFSKAHIRAIDQNAPILLIDDTKTLSPKVISTLVRKFQDFPNNLNKNIVSELKIPYFTPAIYYFGNKFYISPFIAFTIALLLILGLVLLIFFLRIEEDEDDFIKKAIASTEHSSVSQLLSDIENSVSYNPETASMMMNDAVQF
ncbi:MAG: hypothetical protein ACRCTJ_03485, partial [Brevinema sp.]